MSTSNLRNFDPKYFPLPLHLDFVDGVNWILLSDFEYHRDCEEIIKVPKGFLTDGASIPKVVWSWIGHPLAEYAPASVIHDFCCQWSPRDNPKADYIFYECMAKLKIPYLKRTIMYWAVSLFHILGG